MAGSRQREHSGGGTVACVHQMQRQGRRPARPGGRLPALPVPATQEARPLPPSTLTFGRRKKLRPLPACRHGCHCHACGSTCLENRSAGWCHASMSASAQNYAIASAQARPQRSPALPAALGSRCIRLPAASPGTQSRHQLTQNTQAGT